MQFRLALQDLKKASSQYRIWLHLGLLEVKQRYRRSVLGPWWISINMLIFILVMGKIFSRLFAQNLSEYIPFFTTGFLLWTFVSSCMNEATEIFKMHSGYIKQIKLPYNLYILKFLTRNFIYLAHNFVVYFLVAGFYKLNLGLPGLLALPGMLLLLINMYWICLLITLISTRYRDMTPIVNSMVQILFFVTPISWMPKLLGPNSLVVILNPFVHLLDIVRKPLLGQVAPLSSWVAAGVVAVIGSWVTLKIFSVARTRIPFWVD